MFIDSSGSDSPQSAEREISFFFPELLKRPTLEAILHNDEEPAEDLDSDKFTRRQDLSNEPDDDDIMSNEGDDDELDDDDEIDGVLHQGRKNLS